jgi:uncharacterized membrane protein
MKPWGKAHREAPPGNLAKFGRNEKMRRILFVYFASVLLLAIGTIEAVHGAQGEEKDRKPDRAIFIYPEYPVIVAQKGEEVRMDLRVVNGGKSDEDVLLSLVHVPDGWKARIKTYSFPVKGVHVPKDSTKTLTFLAEPDKGIGPGEYSFKVKATTTDGKLSHENTLTIEVASETQAKDQDIVLTTSYPVLRGPSDATFEFSLDIQNKTDQETSFDLLAKGPKDWQINFKPAYEDKYISSLRLKENQSRNVAVQVKPPRLAPIGEYPITVTVSSGKSKAEAQLTVVLTGTYKLEAGTPTGLLSLSAQQGKTSQVSLYVKNTGTAPNHDITFLSFKPENWKVEFQPERIDVIEPGDLKQVEVRITPAQEALVGDYSVGVSVKGEKANADVELRVTVKASPFWAWVGIGVILAVIAGLCVLFIVLGRR